MMEVQQRLSCLSPTQRLPLPPLTPAMIIESSLHTAAATPPDSPQQGEVMPTADRQSDFSLGGDEMTEKTSLSQHPHALPQEAARNPPVWTRPHQFSPAGMAREGVEEEQGAPSPLPSMQQQHSPEAKGEEQGSAELPSERPLTEMPEEVCAPPLEDCYTPPSQPTAPSTPTPSQDFGDRRKPRKQTIEDIVRRIATSEPEDAYQEDDYEEAIEGHMEMARDAHMEMARDAHMQMGRGDAHMEMARDAHMEMGRGDAHMEMGRDAHIEMGGGRGGHVTDDEVDGTPLDISRQILNAQACAETAIKRSLTAGFGHSDDMDVDMKDGYPADSYPSDGYGPHSADGYPPPDGYPPANFLQSPRQGEGESGKRAPGGWDGPRMGGRPFEGEEEGPMRERERERKVTVLPKTSPLPPHVPLSLAGGGGGLHSSLPLSSNISETAYSPHPHFSSPGSKMSGGGGWFPGGMPHLFPFAPGLVDGPLGPKFVPFEGKMLAEVDKDYLKCNYCERTFRRQKNLENHIESTHQGKAGQRPKRDSADMYFKCTHCPYTTKHQSNLYVHLRIHTGERPYICGACGVQYSQSHSLKSHIINKHDGHMNFYIKEKRNRSPRGLGYMSTHVAPGDQTIFKIPPPPPSMQQSNMEFVARAIEMAKSSLGGENQPPPSLLHPPPPSMHPHSPLMSPNGPMSGGLFSKPGFPFNGHFGSPGLPFPDLPSNPSPALVPPSPGSHLPKSAISPTSLHNNNNNSSSSSRDGGSGSGVRSELLNLSTSCPPPPLPPSSSAAPSPYGSPGNRSLLSPPSAARALPSPGNPHTPTNNPTGNPANKPSSGAGSGGMDADCGAMDLSTRPGPEGKGRGAGGDCSACVNCCHGNKLKLLRLNVVRMLSILVPNLNFEEKGISADSDSVDELLQDVIESNTHDDDLVH